MDIIESSHFEAVKKFLESHPAWELKVRSYVQNKNRYWEFKLSHKRYGEEVHTAMQFGSALKLLSRSLVTKPGVGNNGSNG